MKKTINEILQEIKEKIEERLYYAVTVKCSFCGNEYDEDVQDVLKDIFEIIDSEGEALGLKDAEK